MLQYKLLWLWQGGQDIISMLGQIMKPKKTEITGNVVVHVTCYFNYFLYILLLFCCFFIVFLLLFVQYNIHINTLSQKKLYPFCF